MITGLPGSGKTYFATALAQALKGVHLNTDGVRKAIGKMGQYDQASKSLVYTTLLQKTAAALRTHQTVIVDGTFYKNRHREEFIGLALQHDHSYSIIEIQAQEATIKTRLAKPREDSEADYTVHLKIKKDYEPIVQPHLTLWSDEQNLKHMIRQAKLYLRQ